MLKDFGIKSQVSKMPNPHMKLHYKSFFLD